MSEIQENAVGMDLRKSRDFCFDVANGLCRKPGKF